METENLDNITNKVEEPKNAEAIKALNERLGITDRDSLFNSHELKSVDELLENSRNEFEKFKKEISSKKEEVKKAEAKMNSAMEASKNNSNLLPQTIDSLNNFESTIRTMENLVTTGESIMQKMYDAIGQTDLIDPDVIEATAKIIEAIRISLADIIAFHNSKFQMEFAYKKDIEIENLRHMHKVEIEQIRANNKLEEVKLKQKLKDESDRMKAVPVSGGEVSLENPNTQQWNQSAIMDMMRKMLNASQNS
jgi:sugar-specific transcriptional regulator TrmB